MTVCAGCIPHEFQCNDTVCIELIKRCDLKDDCEGGNDEIGCGKAGGRGQWAWPVGVVCGRGQWKDVWALPAMRRGSATNGETGGRG